MKILFVSSEAYPLIKTGGLGDVSGSLPRALAAEGHQVALTLPGYREVLAKAGPLSFAKALEIYGHSVRLLRGHLPHSTVELWLVDAPDLFDRPGNPYLDPEGRPWPDNALRFALFNRAVAELVTAPPEGAWMPDLVHCNDWQTGLVAPLLWEWPARPALLFTVHNLAYQGLFPWETFRDLGLPSRLWHLSALEFHGQMSFLKGGLVFSDFISTVSPTYAREIQTPEYGCGLDGLLRYRSERLVGILNGIDTEEWNPATDPHLPRNYTAQTLEHKADNLLALRQKTGLDQDQRGPVLGMVGRLVEQKGVDLLVEALPEILRMPVQLVVLGNGDRRFEHALRQWADRFPGQLAVRIGFSEALAHLIEGAADAFLMPSRFEPCGLNQMYSLRYGTPPLVRATGGLADTVVSATPAQLEQGQATGVCFKRASAESLLRAIRRLVRLFHEPGVWHQMQVNGMRQDFSWQRSARNYLQLYRRAIEANPHRPPP